MISFMVTCHWRLSQPLQSSLIGLHNHSGRNKVYTELSLPSPPLDLTTTAAGSPMYTHQRPGLSLSPSLSYISRPWGANWALWKADYTEPLPSWRGRYLSSREWTFILNIDLSFLYNISVSTSSLGLLNAYSLSRYPTNIPPHLLFAHTHKKVLNKY